MSDINATAYWHVRAMMSIILGLSIAQLLRGFARIVQHPGQQKIYFIHLGWVFSTFLLMIHFWWWEARISEITRWTFGHYAFLVFFSSLFYFLAVLLLPDSMEEYPAFRDYFWSRKKWIFGVMALISCADVVDTLWKGHDYFKSLSLEYPIQTGISFVLCLIAIFVRSERFHASFMVLNLIYQITWIARMYNVLT